VVVLEQITFKVKGPKSFRTFNPDALFPETLKEKVIAYFIEESVG
jgi:hypothetical protein